MTTWTHNPDTYGILGYDIEWFQHGGRSRSQRWRKRQTSKLVRRSAAVIIRESLEAAA